nr:hypothetical protein [uncultured Methanolobus sp.]
MQFDFKNKTYSEIYSIFQTRKDMVSKEHTRKIDIFQRSIEVTYNIDMLLNSTFSSEYEATGKIQTGPKCLIPILFERNYHYIIAAHELTKLGLANSSYLNLRAVFEGVMQIYLLQLTKEEADLCYKKELGDLSTEEKKELRNKYQWLKPSKIREILYTDIKKQQVTDLYGIVSKCAHPTVEGAMNDFRLNHKVISDLLDVSLALLAANLIAIHESYFELIGNKENEDITRVLDLIAKEYNNKMPDMVPNNPNILDKLRINLEKLNEMSISDF